MSAETMRIALVGAEDFQAHAMFEALREGGYATSQILPLSGALGALEISLSEDETAEVLLPLSRAHLEEAKVVALFTPDQKARVEVFGWAAEGDTLLMDLAPVAGEGMPLVDPLVHSEEGRPPSGFRLPDPGALYLSRLLSHLPVPVERAVVVQALLPASRFGEQGVRELFAQATSLMNFSPLPTAVLGRQTAFNCWPADTPEAAEGFSADLRALTGLEELPVAYTAVQCGSFHCTALSVLFRAGSPERTAAALKQALAADGAFEAWEGKTWPSPVDMAGKERPVALVAPLDRETLRVWLVYDNAKAGRGALAARLLLGKAAT